MKKVTIQDIAEKLNISFSTVARALNDHPAISDATKKKVQEIARKLNYRPNNIASSLRSGRTNIVGVVVPDLNLSFFSSVVHGIEKVMNENGYSILLYQSNELLPQEVKGIETFLRSRVDGIIASVTIESNDFRHYTEITKRKIPLVFFDRPIEELQVPAVSINDYKGGFIATEHLIQQGYRQIVHLTTNNNLSIFKERLRGYIDALKHYKLPIREELIIRGDFSFAFGQSSIRNLHQKNIAFDAVFALEDYTAMGVIQELKTAGIRIPEQVGVIGFANEAFGELVTPQLSSIDQQSIRMGEETARLFLHTLQHPGKDSTNKKIVLEPLLVVRESSLRNH